MRRKQTRAARRCLRRRLRRMTRRIALVVEDDPNLQAEMTKQLEQAQFTVITAFDYAAALRQLESCQPHIACIDLGLPTQSGYELCEYIRGLPVLGIMPVLVTSERGFPEDMAHAEAAGANAFLKKPFSTKKLLAHVAALLDGPPASRPHVRTLCVP